MTQIITGNGLGTQGSSLGQLGSYGPKGTASLGQGGESVYVNGANGNLVVKQSDGFLADLGLGMNLFQTYNSRDSNANPWRFNFDTHLFFEGTPDSVGSVVTRVDEDGHVSRYTYNEKVHAYLADDGSCAKITHYNDSWIYKEGATETRSIYNNEGLLTSISDADGHTLYLSYEQGHLSRIMDFSGKQRITWTFKQGLLSEVIFLSDGQKVQHLRYEYDSQNRLIQVNRAMPDGSTYWTSYAYVGNTHLLCDINQSDGTSLHIDYDNQDRVIGLTDGEGRRTRYEYALGHTTLTNALGEAWTYTYDEQNRLTGIDGPELYHARYTYEGLHLKSVTQGNQRWDFIYNEVGDCLRVTSSSGAQVVRTYDEDHRLLSETRYPAFEDDEHPGPAQSAYYVYDKKGHLRFEIKADGTVTEHRYDNEGLCLSTRVYLKSGYKNQAQSTPDLNQLTEWAQKQNPQAISLITYQYDWRGAVCETTRYTQINEQGEGLPTPDALTTISRYDAQGRLMEQSTRTDKGLSTTHYLYDALGRLTQTVDNQQHTTTIEYDDAHHRVITTNASGLHTIDTYDQSGLLLNRLQQDDRIDYGQTTYAYDAAGRLIRQTQPSGQTELYFYDTQGRLQAHIKSTGQVYEYAYDNEGHCIQTRLYQARVTPQAFKDPRLSWADIKPLAQHEDRVEQVIYNEHQQIAYKIDAQGALIAYEYNAQGEVLTKTAYANRLMNYNPAQCYRLSDIHPSACDKDRVLRFYYDSEGRVTGQINAAGAATSYRYNAQGLLIETCQHAEYVKSPFTGDWAQDAPLRQSKKDISHWCLYNAAGLKIADIDAEGYLTQYTYNATGQLATTRAYAQAIKTPVLLEATTTLDHLHPESSAQDHTTTYRYDDLNQLIEQETQNGLITRYTYNETGLCLTTTRLDKKTQEARQEQRRYDALGRLTQALDALGAALLNQNTSKTLDEINAIWAQHSEHYAYDKAGRLQSKTNALNQSTRYFYNDEGLLTFSLNAQGEAIETRYNAFLQVQSTHRYAAHGPVEPGLTTAQLQAYFKTQANSARDEVTYYEYNTLGLITLTRKGQANRLTTTYNAFGEIEQSRQRLDEHKVRITDYTYDQRGLLVGRKDHAGDINKSFEAHYNVFGYQDQYWDSRRGQTSTLLDKKGRALLIETPAHAQQTRTYDAFDRLLSVKDKTQTLYTYNDLTNTLTLTRPGIGGTLTTEFNAFGDKITITDAKHNTTRFEYDARGQLLRTQAPEHSTTDYQYDSLGRLILKTQSAGRQIAYTYDAQNRLLTQICDPEGLALTTTYTYDAIGRQLSLAQGAQLTQFTYDNEGRLIQQCLDPKGLNLTTVFSYTDNGQLARQTRLNPQGQDLITAYEWDALGRCLSTTLDPEGLALTTYNEYDAEGNLIRQTDSKHQTTQFFYDLDNVLRYRIDARGVVTEHVYHRNGVKTQTIVYANRVPLQNLSSEASLRQALRPDEHDQHQFYLYDTQNRLITAYDALGHATQYTYDENDNLLSTTQHMNTCSLEELKKGNRPLPASSKEDRLTRFVYDGLNRQCFQLDIKGRITQFQYNSEGLLTTQTRYQTSLSLEEQEGDYSQAHLQSLLKASPKDCRTFYAYDKAGRLSTQISPGGSVTGYTYNDTNLLIATTRYAIQHKSDEGFTQPIKTSSLDRTIRTIYDGAGRECLRISPEGKVVERTLDAAGNVLSERAYALNKEASTSRLTTYNYDVLGRLTQQTDALHHRTGYVYDENNNLIRTTRPDDSVWTYGYDETNQLIESTSPKTRISGHENGHRIDEERVIKTQNEYDSFGNLITSIQDAQGQPRITHYTYDLNNQKTATLTPNATINNVGPKASAQRQEQTQTLTQTWRYNAFGDLIETVDKRGNLTRMAYDWAGRLTGQLDANNALTEYQYDTFDNLIQKTAYANAVILPQGEPCNTSTLAQAAHIDRRDRHETYQYDQDAQCIEIKKDLLLSYQASCRNYESLSPTTRLSYNAFGELVQTAVLRHEGLWQRTTQYYNADGLKQAQINAEGYLTTYTFDDLNQLTQEVQYAKRTTQWTIEAYQAPATDEKDRHVLLTYDVLGQLRSKTLKAVRYQRLKSQGTGFDTITQDLTSHYQYDALGHLTATTDPQGHTAYSYYNNQGLLIAQVGVKTPAGRKATTYAYDALGQLIETRQWAAGAQSADETHFTLNGESTKDILTQNAYDDQGHLIEQTDGTGHSLYYSYDANGNVARSWQTLTRANKSQLIQDKRYTYDAQNHLIESATIKEDGTYAKDCAQYNLFGEVIAKGLNGQFTTHMDYDNAGRLWRSNLKGHYQIHVYDLCDNLTQVVSSTNAFVAENEDNGLDLSTSNYDTSIRFDQGLFLYALQRQDNDYDALGRLIAQNKDKSYTEDDKKKQKPISQVGQRNTLDAWGNVLAHKDARGYSTHYEYNALDQLYEQRLPEVQVMDEHGVSRLLAPVLYIASDALGRRIGTTDANGHSQAQVLDAEGQVLQDIDAKGQHRDKTYNLLGQLASTTNERHTTTYYTYDKANRLIQVTTGNASQGYAYDEAGQLIEQTNALGLSTQYAYDALGHQILRQQNGHSTQYTYDDAGHKTTERDAKNNTQYWAYDAQGQLQAHTDLGGHTTEYTYNTNGLLLTEKGQNGKSKRYHYYSDGQLLQYVDEPRKEVLNFAYDDEGNVINKSTSAVGEWLVENDVYEYDAQGRLVQVRRRHPDDKNPSMPNEDKSLLSIDYAYDAAGNIRYTKAAARYPGHAATEQSNYFLYDENNRMTVNKGELQNGHILNTAKQGSALSYDEAGNLAAATRYDAGAQHTYTYDYNEDNRLKRIRKDGIDLQAKIYDLSGNVLDDYLYDTKGRLSQHQQMAYDKGLLASQVTFDRNNTVVSTTHYTYDAVDNLEQLTTVGQGWTQRHQYSYALWDSYQQTLDAASLESTGNPTTYGQSTKSYDVNGQLQSATDSQGTHSTQYATSSLEGIRARQDAEGQTSYLTVAGKTIGDLRLDKNGTQHLDIYSGFTPTGVATQSPTLFAATSIFGGQVQQNKPVEQGIEPQAPQDQLGAYTTQSGDTLEGIALQVYGDASLWYLIADANGLTNRNDRAGERDSQLHAGARLNIPSAAKGQHQTQSTHAVFSQADWLGNTSATAPLPPQTAPSLPKKNPWRFIAQISIAIIATLATVVSAGALGLLATQAAYSGLGTLLGLGTNILAGTAGTGALGTLALGFSAGFIGNIAGQGAAAAFGLQQGIDIKSALITGLVTGATAGFGHLAHESANYNSLIKRLDDITPDVFSVKSAAQMMERDVISQGINQGARKHQRIDWLDLSISTATAGFLGGTAGQKTNEVLQHTLKKAAPTVSAEIQTLATAAIKAKATHNHLDAQTVLIDNLGSAIANNLIQETAIIGLEEAAKSAVDAAKAALEEKSNAQALNDMLGFAADTRAEQSRGAWRDEAYEDLTFSSDLMEPLEIEDNDTSYDRRAFWQSRNNMHVPSLNNEGYDELYGSKTLGVLANVQTNGATAPNSGEGVLAYDTKNTPLIPPLAIPDRGLSRRTIGVKDLSNQTPLPLVDAITNSEFTDAGSLSKAQIKKIIRDHNPILLDKAYKVDEVIYQAAIDYQINPRALLATLQQEQNWGLNGRITKLMGHGQEGHPVNLSVKTSIVKAAKIYRRWYDFGEKSLKMQNPESLRINYNDNYTPRTAAEYSKLKYTPWTYYDRQKSRPYDQWVSTFRNFK